MTRKRSEDISKEAWAVAAQKREHGLVKKKKVKAATKHAHAKAAGILALGGYDTVLAQQGGRCAICGRPPKVGGRKLDIDHNHTTGQCRGLLCPRCNRMLGWAMDRPATLDTASIYLRYGYQAACAYRDAPMG